MNNSVNGQARGKEKSRPPRTALNAGGEIRPGVCTQPARKRFEVVFDVLHRRRADHQALCLLNNQPSTNKVVVWDHVSSIRRE